VLALKLALAGAQVRYVTTEGRAGSWSLFTAEQDRTQRQLLEQGVTIEANLALEAARGGEATLACVFTGRVRVVAATAIVLVTSRQPEELLYRELVGEGADDAPSANEGPRVERIGDCLQPALIAHAVYSGHRAARALAASTAGPHRDRVVI